MIYAKWIDPFIGYGVFAKRDLEKGAILGILTNLFLSLKLLT
jgi:hypothetical protein